MARVITFSTHFPIQHPRKAEPTWFVEQILNSLIPYTGTSRFNDIPEAIRPHVNDFALIDGAKKCHTIRRGNRWKVGDIFSPRIWSEKPYQSKQVEISQNVEIKKIWDIKIDGYFIWINKRLVNKNKYGLGVIILAENDGLSTDDFWDWFPQKAGQIFEGQIICWDESIEY